MKREKAIAFIEAVKKIRDFIPDDIALENRVVYPEWKASTKLSVGDRILYKDNLYKVLQEHTSQIDWAPDTALTLFQPIDITNDGSFERPFVAAVGMTYFKDRYYLDETDGKKYLCIRDDTNGSGTTLYHLPSALVGNYFELSE
jgi:hypothetical protein